jgi:hypothetical protein
VEDVGNTQSEAQDNAQHSEPLSVDACESMVSFGTTVQRCSANCLRKPSLKFRDLNSSASVIVSLLCG